MEIILVRHGQPDWSPNGRVSNDPSLTDLGLAQSRRLGTRRWGGADRLWVSEYTRSQQTAEPLAEPLGMAPEVQPWLSEIAPAPDWEGSPVEEMEEAFAAMSRRPMEELWDGMPGAESFRDFHRRVTNGLTEALGRFGVHPLDHSGHLWTEAPEARLLLVAHGGTNAVVIGHLLGLDPTPWEWDRFDSAHTSVATVTSRTIAGATAFGLVGFGDVTHLDPDMVTR